MAIYFFSFIFPICSDARDLEFQFPKMVDRIREYYRVYKLVDGKPENKYAFGGELLARHHAREVIEYGSTDYRRSPAYIALLRHQAQPMWDAVVRADEQGDGFGDIDAPQLSDAKKTDPHLTPGIAGPQVH